MKKTDEVEYDAPSGRYTARFWTDDDGIVFAEAVGFEDLEACQGIMEIIRGYCKRQGRPIRACLDASRHEGMAADARKYMLDNLLVPDSPMRRFAVVGGSRVARTLFNLYARVSQIPMKQFASAAEAMAWLREG